MSFPPSAFPTNSNITRNLLAAIALLLWTQRTCHHICFAVYRLHEHQSISHWNQWSSRTRLLWRGQIFFLKEYRLTRHRQFNAIRYPTHPPTHPWGLLQCPRCPDADVFNAGYSLAVAYHSILDSLLLFCQLNIWVDLFIHSVWKSHNISKDVIRSYELICYIWLFVPVVLVRVRQKHSRNPQISHQTQQLAAWVTGALPLDPVTWLCWLSSHWVCHLQVISGGYTCLPVGVGGKPGASFDPQFFIFKLPSGEKTQGSLWLTKIKHHIKD